MSSVYLHLTGQAGWVWFSANNMKTEKGVMIMKNGKAWGIVYEDGHSTSYGWMDAESAPIHDPKYCKRPTDVTHKGSPDAKELSTAKLVMVERTTTVTVLPNGHFSKSGERSP